MTGQLLYQDVDLLQLSEAQMRRYWWNNLAMVFQGAMNVLNPVWRIGDQIAESIILYQNADKVTAHEQVESLLDLVGIAPQRARQYPHEYSGRMRQRAMIAMALTCSPDILIADEPTTALDVMIQAQILELLQNLQEQLGLAIVLVTHDLGVVAKVCDDVVVMYGGKVAESGPVDHIFNAPQHPYTQRLMQAFPDIDSPDGSLTSIPGHPPSLDWLPLGCRFEPRCHLRQDGCLQMPQSKMVGADHRVACHLIG